MVSIFTSFFFFFRPFCFFEWILKNRARIALLLESITYCADQNTRRSSINSIFRLILSAKRKLANRNKSCIIYVLCVLIKERKRIYDSLWELNGICSNLWLFPLSLRKNTQVYWLLIKYLKLCFLRQSSNNYCSSLTNARTYHKVPFFSPSNSKKQYFGKLRKKKCT